jgi:hypothetical protein
LLAGVAVMFLDSASTSKTKEYINKAREELSIDKLKGYKEEQSNTSCWKQ